MNESWQCWKKKPCQPRILYPAKIYLENEYEIKAFSNKQKLREFVASKTHTRKDSQGSTSGWEEMIPEWKWYHVERGRTPDR